jgi:hypothetical protein
MIVIALQMVKNGLIDVNHVGRREEFGIMVDLNPLQKALDEFLALATVHDTDVWYERFTKLFSAFKVEYDNQLHVPRFSICMSSEDYDRLVHIPRKQLEDMLTKLGKFTSQEASRRCRFIEWLLGMGT